ncbi:MAG: DNA repair protein RadC [Prevotellaceae bacterium]|jgi:DNA repair protein RadC|nr:DNA repair protein RadC [Prevotellaceae bacterium]
MGEENKRLTIKSWAEEDRPREKMIEKGPSALSDAELIAIILGSGTREMTVVDLAKHLLNSADNDLNKLGKMSILDFQKLKGIGQARAVTVAAALELGRRRKDSDKQKKTKVACSKEVYNMFAPILADLPYEEFWMLFLTAGNDVIDKVKISQGGTDKTIADVKLMTKLAVERLATFAVAVHNHPSGNLMPSNEDILLTVRIKAAFDFFGIKLVEHVIISDNRYYSFADDETI